MSIIGTYCQLDLGPEVGRSRATQIPFGWRVAAVAVRPISPKAVAAMVFLWQHPHPTLVVPTTVPVPSRGREPVQHFARMQTLQA